MMEKALGVVGMYYCTLDNVFRNVSVPNWGGLFAILFSVFGELSVSMSPRSR